MISAISHHIKSFWGNLKRPSFIGIPSAMTVIRLVMSCYHFAVWGVIYYEITELRGLGLTTDEPSNSRPVAFVPYCINGQYVVRSSNSSCLCAMDGMSFVILGQTTSSISPMRIIILVLLGLGSIIVAVFMLRDLMQKKLCWWCDSAPRSLLPWSYVEVTARKPVLDFVPTGEYQLAKQFIAEKKILYLHGLAGSGKTEIAKQLGVDYGEYFIIKCVNKESINNDLIKICQQKNLDVGILADDDPLEKFLIFIQPPDASAHSTFCQLLILDDVADITHVLGAIRQERDTVRIVVTTQKNPFSNTGESIRKTTENVLKITGFNADEAKTYLEEPIDRLKEILDDVTSLPIALSTFKQELMSNKLRDKDYHIDRYISDPDKKKNKVAVERITKSLERAVAENPFYLWLVKHLSVFSRDAITADILVSLVEEYDQSKGNDDANGFLNFLMDRSLCTTTLSDTGLVFLTIHKLVKQAMENLVSAEEMPDILRVSLQASLRVMPLDDRNHQCFILPKMLEHGLCLHNKLEALDPRSITLLTQLLHGQLLTSIGFCMMSQRHDIKGVIERLENGLGIFLKLFMNGNCRDLQVNVEEIVHKDPGAKLKSFDEKYESYIKSLKLLHRLTPRDFKVLFPSKQYEPFHPNLKEGHLRTSVLDDELVDLLMPEEKLEKVYPLELLAYHLHMLARAYEDASVNYNLLLMEKAKAAARSADEIYGWLKREYDVALLGMYVNKCYLLSLRRDNLDTLSREWRDLEEATGKAYECGIARIRNLAEDEHHKLLCLEGQLDTYGKQVEKDRNLIRNALTGSQTIIPEIIDLCKSHMSHMTEAYQKISKFFEICEEYHQAVSYAIKSMMQYHQDCLENQKIRSSQGHPELEEDNRKRFDLIYDRLRQAYDGYSRISTGPFQDAGDTYEYFTSLHRCWQSKVTSRQDGGDLTYSVILDLIQDLESVAAVQAEA